MAGQAGAAVTDGALDVIHATSGELIEYRPVSSLELEYIIRELGDRIERSVIVLDELQRGRYDAEAKYSEAFEMAKQNNKSAMYSDRRSQAIIACLPIQREVNEAKAKLHHAEKLQAALMAKLMGYQNINKVNASAYGVGGVGR
jgi:hypothetical protein